MYSILSIDKACIFLFRTTQFIISSDFPARTAAFCFRLNSCQLYKTFFLMRISLTRMSEKFAFQTQMWAFLEGVETKLVLCFENRYDLL